MFKKPKIAGYFLFMQEMRRKKPGWANKGNTELQSLCDPLWRKLSKEEKDKYKAKKKEIRLAERMRAVESFVRRNNIDTSNNPDTFFSSEEKTAAILLDVVSVTKIRVAPERDIKKVQKFLAKNQEKFEKIDPSRVLVGMNAVARFSEDGELYRCRVTKLLNKDLVKVYYLDFGNEEEMSIQSLLQISSELLKIKPLCVLLTLEMMDIREIRNNGRNKAKLEQKILAVDKLMIQLNDSKEAKLFDDDNNRISIKISKQLERRSCCPGLDTIEELEEIEEEGDSSDDFDPPESEDSFNLDDLFEETESISKLEGQETKDHSTATANGEEVVVIVEEEIHPQQVQVKDDATSKQVKIEDSLSEQEMFSFKQVKSSYPSESSKAYFNKSRQRNGSNNNVAEFPASGFFQRKPFTKEIKPSRRFEKEWRVGEEVVAFWETDNIWRLGEIHEIRGSKAQVVASKEVGVKSTFSKINELKPASMPLDLLNAMSI